MARAVARQCQMDPKVYLPLLKTFEDLGVEDGGNGGGGLIGQRVLAGRGSEGSGREGSGMGASVFTGNESLSPMQGVENNQLSHPPDHQVSWQHAHMRYAVNVHLKRWELAIDWCVRLIQCVHRLGLLESTITTTATTITTTSSQSTSSQSISSMISTVQSVALTTSQFITEQACHPSALSKLNAMMMELSSYTLNTTTNTSTTINNNTLLGGVSGIPSSSSGSGNGSNNGTNAISQIYLIAHNLLSKVRVSYGMHCMKRRQYGEASAAFLTTTPPMVMEGE